MGKVLASIGVAMSVAYLAVLWWLTGNDLYLLKSMDLNEVGDYLAGAFGPLTILWLVLGYFQQGIELRQSTEALRQSVDQQESLARHSHEALQLEQAKRADDLKKFRASMRPILTIESGSPLMVEGTYILESEIINDGSPIYGVEVFLTRDGVRDHQGGCRVLERAQSRRMNIQWTPSGSGDALVVEICYSELDGTLDSERFIAVSGSGFGEVDFSKVAKS